MNKARNELRQEADHSATLRGHDMIWEEPFAIGSRIMQNARCLRCPSELQINTKPLPNEIDIGGSAVAIGCPAK